jgi:6-phospho-3-hexuloisomerase
MPLPTYPDLVNEICAELLTTLKGVSEAELAALRQAILDANRIFVAGKGRSGLFMRAFAMRLMHLGLTVYVVDDVTTPAIGAGDLLVIGSGSGSTASLAQYATRAKSLQARLALITTAGDSPIGAQADYIVFIPAPSPKRESAGTSIQPMANLFEQTLLLVLDVLTIQLMSDLNLTSEQMFARHANLE